MNANWRIIQAIRRVPVTAVPIVTLAQNIYARNNGSTYGLFLPNMAGTPFDAPAGMTESTTIAGTNPVHANGYIYYATATALKRYKIADGTTLTISPYSADRTQYDRTIIVVDDNHIIFKVGVSYAPYEVPADFLVSHEIGDFSDGTYESICELSQYSDDWDEIFYYATLGAESKLIITSYVPYIPLGEHQNWEFNFYVYEISTHSQLQHATPSILVVDASMRYQSVPLICIGSKVYLTCSFDYTDVSGDESTAIIYEFDTSNGAIRSGRPNASGNNLILWQGCYNPSTGMLNYIGGWDSVNNTYGVVEIDPSSLSATILYSHVYSPDDPDAPAGLLLASDKVYMITMGGTVYSSDDDFSSSLRSTWDIPYLAYQWEYSQPHRVCNLVDENGIIWVLEGDDLIGYPAEGGDATVIYLTLSTTSYASVILSNGVVLVCFDGSIYYIH